MRVNSIQLIQRSALSAEHAKVFAQAGLSAFKELSAVSHQPSENKLNAEN